MSLNYARHFRKIHPTALATLALTGGAISLAPLAFIYEGIPHIEHIESWGALLYIGLIATMLPFLIMYRILERVGATNFSTTTFIAPISAAILGLLVLGEAILPLHIVGMAGIFIGILIIDGRIKNLIRFAKM